MTAEQLEQARAERMRQSGHGAIALDDVRTWIEETGLCIFLPRSAQAGFTAPTFVEAVAGQRTTDPSPELIATSESLLVRLEAEGVAVRLNLGGQPLNSAGDQPDYIVASWVLPYIYALRGDRDWRRSPQLTGSRQVSPLAVQAAKQIDTGNQTSMQIRDALGREVTETAVLRALHELWKQLRIIPVVSEVGAPALWQPLRQRFQKAIAEGASTSQVTAISVLASIYLQAVIAASMEDVELFLSPLTSRSKIREVVRGLAATRQVHSTTLGHCSMFYVAGTLPEFPVTPSFQISTTYSSYRNSNYRGSTYLGSDPDQSHEDDFPVYARTTARTTVSTSISAEAEILLPVPVPALPPSGPVPSLSAEVEVASVEKPSIRAVSRPSTPAQAAPASAKSPRPRSTRPSAPRASGARPAGARPTGARPTGARPAAPRTAAPSHARNRSAAAPGESRANSGDRRRAPAPRGASRPTSNAKPAGFAKSNGSNSTKGNGTGNGNRPHSNGNGAHTAKSNGAGTGKHGSNSNGAYGKSNGAKPYGLSNGNGHAKANGAKTDSASKPIQTARPGSAKRSPDRKPEREPAKSSASKRYSFSGQAKQAPKPAATSQRASSGRSGSAAARPSRASAPKRRG